MSLFEELIRRVYAEIDTKQVFAEMTPEERFASFEMAMIDGAVIGAVTTFLDQGQYDIARSLLAEHSTWIAGGKKSTLRALRGGKS